MRGSLSGCVFESSCREEEAPSSTYASSTDVKPDLLPTVILPAGVVCSVILLSLSGSGLGRDDARMRLAPLFEAD